MKRVSCEMRVLIKGRPVTEFVHEGETFMEGRGGSEFEIEIRNTTGNRVMAVVSVDGLSVISGAAAGLESPGYIIQPYQTVVIPGWKLDQNKAAKFEFGSRGSSYVQATEGSAANCGVLGLMVWSEKPPPPPIARRLGGSMYPNAHKSPWNDIMYGATSLNAGGDAGGGEAISKGATASAATASVNNLGTGFGGSTTFNTSTTTFEQEAVIETMVMYYDDARGLKARGIVIERPTQRYTTTPNPFPAMNCTPPKGWKG